MHNFGRNTCASGGRGKRAPAIATALALVVLQASAYAGESKGSESQPSADTVQAESAPAPAGSSESAAQAKPYQPAPPQTDAPIPPPPATSPPAPQAPPPGYGYPYSGPPPGYPYPPPGYGPGYYAPPPAYPYGYRASPYPRYEAPLPDEERQHAIPRRIFTLSLGFGMGALSGGFWNEADRSSFRLTQPGFSYTLRFAAAVNDSWLVQLALDGTWVDFSDGRIEGDSSRSSTIYSLGAQYFMTPWLYSRLGMGVGCLESSNEYGDHYNCSFWSAAGGVGIEFYQQHNMAVAAELAGTFARYTSDEATKAWFGVGGNVVISFF